MSKPCTVCGLVKALSEYGAQASRCDGLKSECRVCSKAKRAVLLTTDLAGTRAKQREANVKATYKITSAEYKALIDTSNGKCALCGGVNADGNALAVDHCHASGRVRGMLCVHCNLGLGHFKDSVATLEKAIAYLKGSNE